jgi:flavin reductase (DIM6/NTAB) family NADH-FMN oxidoreductase RutF
MKQSIGAKTIVYPTPVFIVGTYDDAGQPNIMAAAWAGICCSRPPCVSVSLRKATYSYGNIVARQAFTVSLPSESFIKHADYAGMASGRRVNKFEVLGLTPVRSDLVDAPYVAEFPLALECRLLHTIEIGLHTAFIGEILDVKADASVLDENGQPHIEKIKPVIFATGPRAYYGIGQLLGDAFSIGKALSPD